MRRLVFISYRRERGYALAHLVDAELRSRGLRTFIDVAESDPGQFWTQIQAAIRSCRAVVLICTNGSFQAKAADDWVLREITEAMALSRPIVPVFSQDWEPPSALPPPLAQAIEYNGVSMDTQFHVAAFDHLSQLVGGRKRSEQRRRVALFGSLALLTLLTSLALGAREIIRLNQEVRREREAGEAASARSEKLSQDMAAIEKKRADERSAAEERQRQGDARSKELEKNLAGMERSSADERRAATERQEQAERQRQMDNFNAGIRHNDCINKCSSNRSQCESDCRSKINSDRYATTDSYRAALDQCYDTCKQYESLCKNGCQ